MPQFRKWFNRAVGKNNYANVSINGTVEGVTLAGNTPLAVSPTEIIKARVPNAHWFRFACLVLCLCATGVCVLSYADIRGYGLPPSDDINDQCRDRCTADKSSMCRVPEEVQFRKFIWFITDGYPYSLAHHALEMYEEHSVPYLVEVYGTKWSHTIYTSWFTGLTAMNLFGDPIVGDNLFAAIRRAKDCNGTNDYIFDIQYYGPEWAPLVLIGGAEKARVEYGIESELVLEKLKELVAYPSIPPERLPIILEDALQSGKSLILHSGQFDKATHLLPEESYNQIGVHLDAFFSLPTLKNFTDSHPEYLLILSSDHGMTLGKKIFHGQEHAGEPNNIGFMNFYNPVFEGRAWQEIQVVDVLPTLSKYLEGVDIPYHSIGLAKNYYPPQYGAAYLKVAKQNLAQLAEAASFRRLDFNATLVQELMNSDDYSQVEAMASDMKQLIYRPRLPTHAFVITFFTLLIVAFFALWVKVVNKGDILRTTILAAPLFFVFLFVWTGFKRYLLDTGAFSVILSSLLIMVDVYFSPAKIPLLLGNETLNWIDWALHLGVNALPPFMTLWVSLFGTALSLIEGLVWVKGFIHVKMWVYLHLHVALFFATQNVDAMYFMWDFHFVCFTLYVAIFATIIYYIVRRRWAALATPFTVLFLLLRAGDISVVFLNFQFHQILPRLLVDKINPSVISLQASTLYITNHILWFFSYPMGERFNMDVNPLNGLVGVTNWNQYPSYSGFLMGFSKYGIFGLSMILVPTIVKNRLPLVTLSFQAFLTALACHWVIAVYQAQYHAVESAVAMTGAFTVHIMGFVFNELLEPPKIDYINAKRF